MQYVHTLLIDDNFLRAGSIAMATNETATGCLLRRITMNTRRCSVLSPHVQAAQCTQGIVIARACMFISDIIRANVY